MTHSLRTVAEHAQDARSVLNVALQRTHGRPAEQLVIDAEAMSEHPEDYTNRVLAEDVYANRPIPLFDNSQMDGYAVRSEDLRGATAEHPVSLRVAGTVAAGDRVSALDAGTVLAIMTGAAVPVGATAVIPIEAVQPTSWVERDECITIAQPVPEGQFIRHTGSDIEDRALILAAGHRLGPASWGTLASAGVDHVRVVARPHALVVVTGLELRNPGATVRPGQLYDANTFSMLRALSEAGCTTTPIFCPSDDPVVLSDLIAPHLADADFLVTVGGVSAGRFEVVKEVLAPAGVRFHHLGLQPGGPQGLGIASINEETIPTFSFPGNPVSALISFELFLRRGLRAATGLYPNQRDTVTAQLSQAITSPAGKLQIRRAILNGNVVHLIGGPSSHLLHAYALANALAFIPADITALPAWATVDVWKLNDLPLSPHQVSMTRRNETQQGKKTLKGE